jgi:hypothetical protein
MERLSSLKLTLWALIAICVWLGLGVLLSQTTWLAPGFKAMNQILLLDWLLGPAWQLALVPVWFLVLCLGVGVMLLNLAACTLTRLLPRLRSTNHAAGWLLTLAHLVMLVVLLGHVAEMGLGHKQEDVRLLPGQRYKMADGRLLTLSRVNFAGDPAILNLPYRQARWAHTRAAFTRAANVAAVEVSGGDEAVSGELRITEPLVTQGVRVTLTDFFRVEQAGQALVGASLTVGANPLTPVFMSAYALWVAVYLALAILTWREQGNGSRANERA